MEEISIKKENELVEENVDERIDNEEEEYKVSQSYKNYRSLCSTIDGFLPLIWCSCCMLWIVIVAVFYSLIQKPVIRITVVSSVSVAMALLIISVCMLICFFPFVKDISKRLLFKKDVKKLKRKDNPMIPEEAIKRDDKKRMMSFMIRFFSWFLCCVCLNVWIMAAILIYIVGIDHKRNGFGESTSVLMTVGITVGCFLTCVVCCIVFVFGTVIAKFISPSGKSSWSEVIEEFIEEGKKMLKTGTKYAKRGKKELEQYIDFKRNLAEMENEREEEEGEDIDRMSDSHEIVQDMGVEKEVNEDDFDNVVADLDRIDGGD